MVKRFPKKLFLLSMIISNATFFCVQLSAAPFVTYAFSGGRFGDQLLSYIHGKWIEYTYHIPLIYQEFFYSKYLMLHTYEHHAAMPAMPAYLLNDCFMLPTIRNAQRDMLLVIPYFSEFAIETPSPLFTIDWHDQSFKELLKEYIKPRQPLSLVYPHQTLPSVALHMRTGGIDDPAIEKINFPLKLPPFDYYWQALNSIYDELKQPLDIFIFTDHPNPPALIEYLQEKTQGLPYSFRCHDPHTSHSLALHDFFSMINFNMIIRTESNYSYLAARLGNPTIEITPAAFTKHDNEIIITQARIIRPTNNSLISLKKGY